jgi:hypothetical protein
MQLLAGGRIAPHVEAIYGLDNAGPGAPEPRR